MMVCEKHDDCVVVSERGSFDPCPVCQMQKQLDAERSRTEDLMSELRDAQAELSEKQAECEKLRAECEDLRNRGPNGSLDVMHSEKL